LYGVLKRQILTEALFETILFLLIRG